MATATRKKSTLTSYDDLTAEVKTIMDRAVRVARTRYWCDRFSEAAPEIFNVAPTDVVDSDGFSCKGYNRQGFNAEGFNLEGYNTEGFSTNGFNKAGYDKDGYDRLGVNKDGVDRHGRDKYRYDTHGYDQDGYDSIGQRRRASRDWYTRHAARPETDFCYDQRGEKRPVKRTTATPKVATRKAT